ncbi:MAG: hypothetical protein WBN04_03450 [Paracoccaceae bacterium]
MAILGGLTALVLGGCASTEGTRTAAASAPGSEVGPGPAAVDAVSASKLFNDVCGKTAPSFRKAPAVMAELPFRQNTATGTYYHQSLDLSFKLLPKRCSMVFGSVERSSMLGLAMATSTGANEASFDPISGAATSNGPKGTSLEFQPVAELKGRAMYRAVLIAP